MKKRLILSVIALIYIIIYKFTNFEFGDIASATLLIYVGLPFFVLVSVLLFIISFYNSYKEKFNVNSVHFNTLFVNIISIILTFSKFLSYLNPINW